MTALQLLSGKNSSAARRARTPHRDERSAASFSDSYYVEMKDPKASHLRADARQNRARILETARKVFAERGLATPLALDLR